MAEARRAWLTRSGKYGERDDWAMTASVTPGGYGDVPDLSGCGSLDEVRQLVAVAYPDASRGALGNYAAQLWALAGRMQVGDLVVLPLKASSQLAIGELTGGYRYNGRESDPERRHIRPVRWIRTDAPRSAIKQDLLYSLGAFSTYCQLSRNEAVARLAAVAQGQSDPGTKVADRTALPSTTRRTLPSSSAADPEVPDAEDSAIDLESYAQGRIERLVQEEFAGHRLAALVEALLSAEGYTCWRAPEGTDGGIDLLAGSGPLGLDSPHLVVQVKSEQSAVGDPTVSQLLGTMTKHGNAA